MPKGLYVRALVIVIAPMVLLQSILAYVFMERHWQTVTERLSAALSQDIAALVDLEEALGAGKQEVIEHIAAERLNLDVEFMPPTPLPPPAPKPFFQFFDEALAKEIRRHIHRPYWVDTIGRSNLIEIRVQLEDATLRVVAHRSQAYASNSGIFLAWMAGSSLFLLTIAVLFLRNQIRPILRLADAAESFGKGRDIEFRPRGAREVRKAGHAFIEMKRRLERMIDQRTTMLAGVSHDLRTVLTRFRLSLELLEEAPEIDEMHADVNEMSRMLEGYLAFARGDAGEQPEAIDVRALLDALKTDAERLGHKTEFSITGDPVAVVRPRSFKRCLTNLVLNAVRYAERIEIDAVHDARVLTITVDDDGPGIPLDRREDVFKPFLRLEKGRTLDSSGGTGLGLTIARDIARAHGGDITLSASPLGGLRATVRVPG
ncbi:MAG: HAMP domain-containing protein [Hyphomicrobiales bacterium]|nr:HAMP domain-containing protein [Hyphomicrobiales bacterium]MBV9433177.1 HAMP domain-containing protein [Hyphomicrobiales bacterium]MBV9740649.1 HAMP domain-containing protein [Hyphomicrobiales bacterium]MBW0005655.1 HAMP domain-containing protein [Hyphomicrobiales bacterium]